LLLFLQGLVPPPDFDHSLGEMDLIDDDDDDDDDDGIRAAFADF